MYSPCTCVSVCVRRRLSASARPAAEPAEHTGGGNVPVPGRRQLRHAGGHGAVAGLLQGRVQLQNAVSPSPSCLDLQLQSFKKKKVLARIAPGDDAAKKAPWRVPGGAGLLGEIGGNDYNFWFSGPRHAGPVHSGRRRPHRRHRAGGDRPRRQIVLVVPGNFPIGCAPQYLGMFRSDAASDYDQHGCLAWFNDFSRRNNRLLQQQEVGLLRSQNPSAKIIFADYFGVAIACRSSRTPGNTVRRRC